MAKFPIQETEKLSIKPVGLYTYPNAFSAVPPGALRQAVNIVIDRPNVIEQRRGVASFGTALSAAPNKFFSFQNRLLTHYGTAIAYDSDGSGTWVDYSGSYAPPSGALTIHSVAANKNLYLSTSTGVKKVDSLTGTIKAAGAPPGLDGSGSTTGSGWFTNSKQVAYRVVFGYTDANSNLILGAPSQRIVVSNSSGGATNVVLVFTIPAGLDTTWQYQIYRSPMSIDLNTEPNDECALVYTGNITSQIITDGYCQITDTIDDSLKGAMIYTASSQQGIANSNYQPPVCRDMATFRGYTFYSDVTSQQQLLITLLTVGSPNGLQVDDTLTIGGVTYTGKASETVASAQFKVFTSGTPSQNITNTANSLVKVINRYASSTVYAYYQSGYADLPGKILLSERGIGGAAFTVACSRTGTFVPNLSTTPTSSGNSRFFNGIRVSKYLQPEAIPLGQLLYAGSADKLILRIIALRDYMLIFKQDGVYQITGTDINSFSVQEVDRTTILRGIETAVALNNKVFLYSNQTVISLTFNEGAILKSQPIKKDLLVLSSPSYPNFDSVSYGIAYESDNKYILGTIKSNSDTSASQFFVYNYLTDAWTTWETPYPMKTGLVNPLDDRLYFGSGNTPFYVYQERKNFDSSDYADAHVPIYMLGQTHLIGSDTSIVQIADTTGLLVGSEISQTGKSAYITEINDSTHFTVDTPDILSWAASPSPTNVMLPIPVSIKFVPEAAGNPGIVKNFKEFHPIFSTADFSTMTVGFSTNFTSYVNTIQLSPKLAEGWGTGPNGDFPWGGGAPDMQVIRGLIPIKQRNGHWLNIGIDYAKALTSFALDGYTLFYQDTSQRFH